MGMTHDHDVAGYAIHGEIEHAAQETTAVDCLTDVGGVVAMRPLIVHASSKSASPGLRRVLHIEYAASLTLAPGVDLAVA
jgi:hypothetical protein